MLITKKSPFSGVEHTLDIPVTSEQLREWQSGKGLIQDIMPNLTPGEREFLMTGITDEEFDSYLGNSDN